MSDQRGTFGQPAFTPMTIAIRLYVEGHLQWKRIHELTSQNDLPRIGEEHAAVLADEPRPWLLEFELLGEPGEDRFIRFGTDRAGMIDPHELHPGSS